MVRAGQLGLPDLPDRRGLARPASRLHQPDPRAPPDRLCRPHRPHHLRRPCRPYLQRLLGLGDLQRHQCQLDLADLQGPARLPRRPNLPAPGDQSDLRRQLCLQDLLDLLRLPVLRDLQSPLFQPVQRGLVDLGRPVRPLPLSLQLCLAVRLGLEAQRPPAARSAPACHLNRPRPAARRGPAGRVRRPNRVCLIVPEAPAVRVRPALQSHRLRLAPLVAPAVRVRPVRQSRRRRLAPPWGPWVLDDRGYLHHLAPLVAPWGLAVLVVRAGPAGPAGRPARRLL